jgi:hypothetical protein
MSKKPMVANGRHSPGAFIRKNGTEKEPTRKYEHRTITKDEARALLAKVAVQRPIDAAWVAGLTRTMDAGLWDCAGGRIPIAIDTNEKLINGQNRLAAFIASKLEQITFLFVTGCAPEDIKAFDTDTKARGAKWSHPSMSFSAREIARLTAFDKLVSGNLRARNTHTWLDNLYQRMKKDCEWAADVMPNPGAHGRGAYMGAFIYVRRADATFADEVCKSWANGGHGLPQPLIRLRDEALRKSALGGARAISANIRASLKLLNALATMHQQKPFGPRLLENLSGLKYFSGLVKDGAGKRWEEGLHVLAGE